jgi:PAS domain S-box-containing protein
VKFTENLSLVNSFCDFSKREYAPQYGPGYLYLDMWLDQSAAAIGISHEGIIIKCNQPFYQMYGYEEHELRGRSITSVISPNHCDMVHFSLSLREQGVQCLLSYEVLGRRKDGSEFVVQISSTVFYKGGKKFFITTHLDLSVAGRMMPLRHPPWKQSIPTHDVDYPPPCAAPSASLEPSASSSEKRGSSDWLRPCSNRSEIMLQIVHPEDQSLLQNHQHEISKKSDSGAIVIRPISAEEQKHHEFIKCTTCRDTVSRFKTIIRKRTCGEFDPIGPELLEHDNHPTCLNIQDHAGLAYRQGHFFKFANKTLLKIFGYSSLDEFCRIPIIKHIAPESRELIRTVMKEAGTANNISCMEFSIIQKGGKRRIVQLYSNKIGHDPSVIDLVILYDITGKRHMEKAFFEIDAKYRAMFDMTRDPILLTDAKTGKILDCNIAATCFFKLKRAQIVDQCHKDIYLPLVKSGITYKIAPWHHNEFAGSAHETKLRLTSGEICDISVYAAWFKRENGELVMDVFRNITQERQYERKAKKATQKIQALSRRIIELQEHERGKIASELHDVIGQQIAGIKFRLHNLATVDPNQNSKEIQQCLEIVAETAQTVRRLSFELRPAMLDTLGLKAALSAYLERQAKIFSLMPVFESNISKMKFDGKIETTCFRVVQESVTNIIKHAKTQVIDVKLYLKEQSLVLQIRDYGVGFDTSMIETGCGEGLAFGILGMQERVDSCGGSFAIESSPGQGTLISAIFPIQLQFLI